METVRSDEWDRVVAHLRRFAGADAVTVDEGDDRVRAAFGSAHVIVTRAGHVDTGMPLHGFETAGPVDLVFDHSADELHVRTEQTSYTFRRP